MNKTLLFILSLFISLTSFAEVAPAPSVHAIPSLKNSTVEVRFTNPDCAEHKYATPVLAQNGQLLEAKKKGAYCTYSDYKSTSDWSHSPQSKLIEWINDRDTKEVFFAFLSGSNGSVLRALCQAIKSRGVKVTYVLDSTSDLTVVQKYLHDLDCDVPQEVSHEAATFIPRGHTGTQEGFDGDTIGYAHNKMFLVNPSDPERIKFTASSGNLSSGAIMHHENWLFFDVEVDSYLAQSHLCLMKSQLNDLAHANKYVYEDVNGECLWQAKQKFNPQKEGIVPFFIPGEGSTALNRYLFKTMTYAKKITLAAHRLGMGRLATTLAQSAKDGKDVRLVVDDDIYWLISTGQKVGDNMQFEADHVERIAKAGANVKYMETNNLNHYLHHNKIILFEQTGSRPEAVWTGAGNFTSAAFYSNFENFYFITIPGVVQAYKNQLNYVFKDLANSYDEMPVENIPTVDDNN